MGSNPTVSAILITKKGDGCMAIGKYKEWLTDDKLLLLQSWARDGLTDEQIAMKMGINVSTLYTWKNKYNEIAESLKKVKKL